MNKKFCDLCGQEIKIKDKNNPYENNIFIRIEKETSKFEIQDACDDCISEFRDQFFKFVKEKEKTTEAKG